MTDFLNGINGFLAADEEAEVVRQFVKDNFCPFDEDPFTHDYVRDESIDEYAD